MFLFASDAGKVFTVMMENSSFPRRFTDYIHAHPRTELNITRAGMYGDTSLLSVATRAQVFRFVSPQVARCLPP